MLMPWFVSHEPYRLVIFVVRETRTTATNHGHEPWRAK